MTRQENVPVVQLGASGPVAETFRRIVRCSHVPIDLVAVAASRLDLVGKTLGTAFSSTHPSQSDVPIISIDQALEMQPKAVFSGLRTDEALRYERVFAEMGSIVFTNAAAHRMDPDVALGMPYFAARRIRDRLQDNSGPQIVANGNCMSIIEATGIAGLHGEIGIKSAKTNSLQGWSGAGLDHIPEEGRDGPTEMANARDEAEKIEAEPNKMLDSCPPYIETEAHPMRAPWVLGHHALVDIELQRETTRVEIDGLLETTRCASRLREHFDWCDLPAKFPVRRVDQPILNTEPIPYLAFKPDPMRVLARVATFDPAEPNRLQLELLGDNLVLGAAGAGIANILYARALGVI